MDSVSEFRNIRPKYEALANKLEGLVAEIARANQLEFHAIESRAKTIESFSEKIRRPGKTYSNPLSEITDLCGLRVILYYQEDVDQLYRQINEEFDVDLSRSVNKGDELDVDQFGYSSHHIICKLKPNRTSLTEWSDYEGMHVEIQIRTVLQHAWASISHALHYKNELNMPRLLARKLSRIAGLLELSDEQFSELRIETKQLREGISRKISDHDLKINISAMALEQYLNASSSAAPDIENSAIQAGLDNITGAILPEQLSRVCNGFNIKYLNDLSQVLKDFSRHSDRYFKEFGKSKYVGDMEAANIQGDRDHWCAIGVVAMGRSDYDLSFLTSGEFWSADYLKRVTDVADEIGI